MEKDDKLKDELLKLLSRQFGEVTEKTFRDFYFDETIPVFVDGVVQVLEDLIGRAKACSEVNVVLAKYNIKPVQ